MINKKRIIIGGTGVICTLIVLVFILGSVYAPEMSLMNVKQSFESQDWEKFQKYVDVDDLLSHAFNDEVSKSDEGDLAKGIASMMSGMVLELGKKKLKEIVEGGVAGSTGGKFKDYASLLKDSEYRLTTEKQGKIATIKMFKKTPVLGIESPITFTMRKVGFMHYKLKSIDIGDYQYALTLEKDAIRMYHELPVLAEIRNSIKIRFMGAEKACSEYFYGSCLNNLFLLKTKVTNISQDTVKQVDYEISNSFGKVKTRSYVGKLTPGKSSVQGRKSGWDFNRFREADQGWLHSSESDIHFSINKVAFSDGKTLSLSDLPAEQSPQSLTQIKERLDKYKDVLTEAEYDFYAMTVGIGLKTVVE